MTPLETLASWMNDARAAGTSEPEAMALATVGSDGRPSVRFVLCRGIDAEGIRFFTNYESRKGREIALHPFVAAVFHWEKIRRQVRVEGEVTAVPPEESDAYFHSRPRGSQLSAAVSPQSRSIENLETLRAERRKLDASLNGGEVPRPSHWGGYRLRARRVELWTSGDDRLHDRVSYERQGDLWVPTRLAP